METIYPLQVTYCPICTLPVEYCEYGPDFNACKKWIANNCPEAYPELAEEFEKIKLGEEPAPIEEAKAPVQAPTKKVKFEGPKQVKIALLKRGATKNITAISGLKDFGIDLKAEAKNIRKKFACGCSVVDDSIELQGNSVNQVYDHLSEIYPDMKLVIEEEGGKKKVNKGSKK
ncbi:unnamed protein product [Blepharisma stoltei]|uniref:SUI1 domain-containing protein n=1 Tax=Blepharisma stoltei TaxID=1481888 RepID=A0AAU9IZG9_9CILI|nr:unnamed protein product [Blepharisma stoltei]